MLLDRASSLVQGFEGGLLVLQVCLSCISYFVRLFPLVAAARVLCCCSTRLSGIAEKSVPRLKRFDPRYIRQYCCSIALTTE